MGGETSWGLQELDFRMVGWASPTWHPHLEGPQFSGSQIPGVPLPIQGSQFFGCPPQGSQFCGVSHP